jgi:very-short-patch-repair endonuclease
MFEINNRAYLRGRRKKLRLDLTPAEAMVWLHLQKGKLRKKFRRQHSIGNYIVDFYCPQAKLVIELDGSTYDNAKAYVYDHDRSLYLNQVGVHVIRFQNSEMYKNLEGVLKEIKKHL